MLLLVIFITIIINKNELKYKIFYNSSTMKNLQTKERDEKNVTTTSIFE